MVKLVEKECDRMLTDLIIKNEKQIERFEMDYYMNQKNYPVVSALAALNTTNDIQKCYFDLQNATKEGEAVLRLYALLQSLFVSVDSLYALSYSLTKSKSLININKNQDLRQLKYIRNDVVGHPANRILNSKILAYCILDDKRITNDEFYYHIYTGSGVEEKKVEIIPLVEAYYIESNKLLDELYVYAKENRKKNSLVSLAVQALDTYGMDGDYESILKQMKEIYLKNYPNASSSQHRVIWRLEQIEKLIEFKTDTKEVQEIAEYAVGLELIKLYQLVSGKLYQMSLRRRAPEWVSSFYRFLNKNKSAVSYIHHIIDLKDPLFHSSMQELQELASQKGYTSVVNYLNLIQNCYAQKEDDLLYSFTLPLREYKKQK